MCDNALRYRYHRSAYSHLRAPAVCHQRQKATDAHDSYGHAPVDQPHTKCNVHCHNRYNPYQSHHDSQPYSGLKALNEHHNALCHREYSHHHHAGCNHHVNKYYSQIGQKHSFQCTSCKVCKVLAMLAICAVSLLSSALKSLLMFFFA